MISVSVLVAACATQPLGESMQPPLVNIKNADYGLYPKNYEVLIKAWVAENLKDPDSARYSKFSKPRQEYMFEANKPFFGYSVCAAINAKNSFGGYTGNQTYWFLIRDGKIARGQNTTQSIGGIVPGHTISRGHWVNCTDGDAGGNVTGGKGK